ncbi:MAG: MarR family winged helix-turn-helix transcriptional regulator [Bilifractor sp.]|jgi:MarR family 2-MHQ and catechol resistance regulon transcriptional repressor
MTEDNYILIKMHRIMNQIDRQSAHIAAAHGLTLSQFGVLEALYHIGDMTVGEVKEKILSSDGTIPVVIKNLEKNGLLSRKQDPDDRRKSILSLTEPGRTRIAEVYPENERMIHNQMKVWSEEEKKELASILRRFPSGEKEDS